MRSQRFTVLLETLTKNLKGREEKSEFFLQEEKVWQASEIWQHPFHIYICVRARKYTRLGSSFVKQGIILFSYRKPFCAIQNHFERHLFINTIKKSCVMSNINCYLYSDFECFHHNAFIPFDNPVRQVRDESSILHVR